jgi:hypothetical protein
MAFITPDALSLAVITISIMFLATSFEYLRYYQPAVWMLRFPRGHIRRVDEVAPDTEHVVESGHAPHQSGGLAKYFVR